MQAVVPLAATSGDSKASRHSNDSTQPGCHPEQLPRLVCVPYIATVGAAADVARACRPSAPPASRAVCTPVECLGRRSKQQRAGAPFTQANGDASQHLTALAATGAPPASAELAAADAPSGLPAAAAPPAEQGGAALRKYGPGSRLLDGSSITPLPQQGVEGWGEGEGGKYGWYFGVGSNMCSKHLAAQGLEPAASVPGERRSLADPACCSVLSAGSALLGMGPAFVPGQECRTSQLTKTLPPNTPALQRICCASV